VTVNHELKQLQLQVVLVPFLTLQHYSPVTNNGLGRSVHDASWIAADWRGVHVRDSEYGEHSLSLALESEADVRLTRWSSTFPGDPQVELEGLFQLGFLPLSAGGREGRNSRRPTQAAAVEVQGLNLRLPSTYHLPPGACGPAPTGEGVPGLYRAVRTMMDAGQLGGCREQQGRWRCPRRTLSCGACARTRPRRRGLQDSAHSAGRRRRR